MSFAVLRRFALRCGFMLACAACSAPPSREVASEPRALFICGGGTLPQELIDAFVSAAGGADARLLLIPGASQTADSPEQVAEQLARWQSRGIRDVAVLHSRDRNEADQAEFLAPLRVATAVWFGGGDQKRLADVYLGTGVERELTALLARGGVIGGTSAGAAIQSRVMIAGGNPEPEIATGLDLLPHAIIDQHFRARKREPRLDAAIRQHPDCVGYGIDEGTALVVHGDRAVVMGRGGVTVVRADATAGVASEWFGAGAELQLRR